MNIPESAENISPLQAGTLVPDVTLTTVEGSSVALHSLLERSTILVFYRGGWCPYCNLQLSGLQTIEAELKDMGFAVFAVSPDLPESLRSSSSKESLSYTLLSDSDMDAAKAFGIAFRVDDETIEKYKGYNIDLEAASGRTHHLLPVPSVFVIDRDGVIRFAHANPDYKVRLSPEEVMSAAKALIKEKQK
jgi:peroxiredoxin